MRSVMMILTVGVLAAGATAAPYFPTQDAVTLYDVMNTNSAVTIDEVDKVFSDFDLIVSGTEAASVDPMNIGLLVGFYDVNNNMVWDGISENVILRFEMATPLIVTEGQNVSLTIEYAAATSDPGMQIAEVGWALDAVAAGVAAVASGGESIYADDLPPSGGLVGQIDVVAYNGAVTNGSAVIPADDEIFIVKDLLLDGGPDGLGGSVTLYGFDQYYVQVPEPATLVLAGLGSVLVLRRRH